MYQTAPSPRGAATSLPVSTFTTRTACQQQPDDPSALNQSLPKRVDPCGPGTPGGMLGEPHVTEAKGTAIVWTEMGEGPPLVLLHGLGDSHRTWRRVAPLLARHFRVIMPDMPGHGLSERPDAPYTLAWYADTLIDWMAAIGLDDAHLCGHSFGGGVAQWMILVDSSRIRKLALVAAGGLGPEVAFGLRLTATPLLGSLLTPSLMAVGTRAMMRQASGHAFQNGVEEIERAVWLNRAPSSGRAFHRTVVGCVDLFGQHAQTWQRIGEVAVLPPTALFWGEADAVLPVRHCREAQQRLIGAHVRTYGGCGHFLHLECASRFARDLRAFIDSGARSPRLRSEAPSNGSVVVERVVGFARRLSRPRCRVALPSATASCARS